MQIAVLNDTHFGCRNDNQDFADYFKKFYDNIFFPYIDENNIKTIIHQGDVVDRRKYINFLTANSLRTNFIQPCLDRDIDLNIIIGNHDTYFKNTNSYNAISELYSYSNISWFEETTEQEFDGTKILFVPWINVDNYQHTLETIKQTTSTICMGHLELKGFEMYKGSSVDVGYDRSIFDKFDIVTSGHFHHKSTKGNIHYLGAPYEMTWSDYSDDRGFHIFDTKQRTLKYITNPYKMFYKIIYDDQDKQLDDIIDFDTSHFYKTYVKIIVRSKNKPHWFDVFLDKIEKSGAANVQIVADYTLLQEVENDLVEDVYDTLSLLEKYISQSNIEDVGKEKLSNLFKSLYNQAILIDQ